MVCHIPAHYLSPISSYILSMKESSDANLRFEDLRNTVTRARVRNGKKNIVIINWLKEHGGKIASKTGS